MFWFSAQKKATKAAVDKLRPIVGILQHNYGLPAHFWSDPYMTGFFQFMIGHYAKLVTGGRITAEDLGVTMVETLTALSNMNGVVIARRGLELQNAQDLEFSRGGDDAAYICYYEMKVLKNEKENPLVIAATRLAGPDASRSDLLGMMFMASLYREVRERLIAE